VVAVSGDAGIVTNERLQAAHHGLLQALADRLGRIGVGTEPCRDGRDTLALPGQQEPGGIPPQRLDPLRPSQSL